MVILLHADVCEQIRQWQIFETICFKLIIVTFNVNYIRTMRSNLGFSGSVGDEADGFDSAMILTQLLQLLGSAGEWQPRDEDLVLLQ